MITKELFIEIIENIKKQNAVDDEISTALEKVCGSYVIFNTENLIYSSLYKLLEEVFKDKGDWIQWWLYEDVEKKAWIGEEEIILENVEQLYDILIKNRNPG